jgi:hypothetical protein
MFNYFTISVSPYMKLQPSAGSDRAWVWSTPADFADLEAKKEHLAIRFGNVESKYSRSLSGRHYKWVHFEAHDIIGTPSSLT